MTVSRKPVANSSADTVRSPCRPRTTYDAPSAINAVGRSAEGWAGATEPPMVPRWRTWGSPTRPAACARIGASRRISSLPATSQWRGSAPHAGGAPAARRGGGAAGGGGGGLGRGSEVAGDRREGEPQLHQRKQRLTAGEQLRLVTVLGQRGQ